MIKYMANKVGGAHHDERRGPKEQNLIALDRLSGLDVDGYSPPFLELLAAIQAVVASPSAMKPFGLEPVASALFDAATGRTFGPVELVKRARHHLERFAD